MESRPKTPPLSRSTTRGTVTAWPFPPCLRRAGMATVSRIAGRSPARCGTVAMPALTSATVRSTLCPRRRPVRPEGGGAACQWVGRRRPERPEDGPVGVGLPGVGRLLPRAPRAINQIGWGMATVIAR